MIINKLIIKRDNGLLKDDLFEFSFGNKTVIYSKDNSVGKTSLLRFIVFALGFKVPSTPGINMNLYTVLLYITNNFGSYYLKREQNKIGIYSLNNELINQYNVFDETQQKSLLKFIFNLNDFSIYNELLGCFFIEQDSGWNITNKGRILLYNKFSLTDLISNLNSNLLQPIKNELLRLRREQNKYRAIYNLLVQTEDDASYNSNFKSIDFNKDLQLLREKQNHLLDRKADIKNSINDIQTILSDNEKLGELIEKYSIVVKIPKNKSFVLRKENILPFNSNNAILQAELNDLQAELSNVDDQLFRIKQSLNSSPFKFDVKTVSDIALKNLKDANIDKSKVNTIVTEIGKDISKLKKQEISILRESENDYSIINECIRKRLLQITGKEFLDVDLIKADNSSFSGVELYNISLSYRLGILDFLENKLGIKLPFIIDSPGNGERVTNDVEKLFNSLLKENRQLIISTAESISEQTLKCFTNKIFAFGRIFENKYEQN